MGAVLGIAAFGRTQEKLNGANNGGIQLPAGTPGPGFSPSFGGVTTPSFGNTPLGGNTLSTAPAFGAKPLGPPPAAQPLL
jgi:hypothetical protein